jgi:hypothetical protein
MQTKSRLKKQNFNSPVDIYTFTLLNSSVYEFVKHGNRVR